MKYEYDIKLHTVVDYNELASVMNKYGRDGIRVIKAEFIGDKYKNNRPMKSYVLYLEKKIKSK